LIQNLTKRGPGQELRWLKETNAKIVSNKIQSVSNDDKKYVIGKDVI
jgi:hypothetical protein